MKVYVVPNAQRPHTIQVAVSAAEILLRYSCVVYMDMSCKQEISLENVIFAKVSECCAQADVIITVGGDGSILHSAMVSLPYGKPILGINVGRCGFLASCEPDQMEEVLGCVVRGEYQLDTRSLLRVTVVENGKTEGYYALNDVIVRNGRVQHAIDVAISCDDIPVQKYRGDGVIVATPTGSTAYSMSAGGPILDARLNALVLTPICPHSLQSSAMVFSADRRLQIALDSTYPEEVLVTCDGHASFSLHEGARVIVTLSDKHIDLISFSNAEQFQAIDKKLRNRD